MRHSFWFIHLQLMLTSLLLIFNFFVFWVSVMTDNVLLWLIKSWFIWHFTFVLFIVSIVICFVESHRESKSRKTNFFMTEERHLRLKYYSQFSQALKCLMTLFLLWFSEERFCLVSNLRDLEIIFIFYIKYLKASVS